MQRLFFLLVLCFIASRSFGQDYTEKEKMRDITKAGFKFDINSSVILLGDVDADTISVTVPEDYNARTGYSFGLFYREAFGGLFGGQVEIRYVQMGAYDKKLDIETHLDYLRLGAQFKLYPLSSRLGANAFVGAEYALLIVAEQEDPDNKGTYIDIKDFNVYKGSDFGIHFGLGLDFDFGLTTDLRLYLGVADIRERSPSGRNLSTQFHLGWGF